ncbi:MAG: hypothetical protein MUO24_10170 [Desulfobacterales bacterium]|nr:hypothetical protein [Desulfobacterales bacterium]
MGDEVLLKIGGIYNILCALLHVLFPRMFKWGKILKLLPGDKRLIIEPSLYIMNWCMVVFWVILAYISLVHTSALLIPGLGRTLLASIVIFWVIRIFVLQPVYIGIQNPRSWIMIGFFLVGLVLFAVPLVESLRSH